MEDGKNTKGGDIIEFPKKTRINNQPLNDEGIVCRLISFSEKISYVLDGNKDIDKILNFVVQDPGSFIARNGEKSLIEQVLEANPSQEAKNRALITIVSSLKYLENEFLIAEAIEVLLEAGADINIKDGNGNNLIGVYLFTIKDSVHGYIDVLPELTKKGCDINAVNKDGYTPFMIFLRYFDYQIGFFQIF